MKNKKKAKAPKKAAKKSRKGKSVVVGTKSKPFKDLLTKEQRARQIEASIGNDFWLQRSTHGRDKLFKSPELMLSESLKYFNWGKMNPEKRSELVKYEGYAKEVEVTLKRPYTMQGLCRYLDCNTAYFRQFKAALRAKGEAAWSQEDKDFSTVIHTIEEIVEEQQVAGALTGHFNANIISRLLGLIDKKDITSDNAPLAAPSIKVYNVGPPLAGAEEEVSK